MNIVFEIEKQYFEIDDQYSINWFEAYSNGYHLKEKYWLRKRELNTHAYFLFLFTRLEDHIKTEAKKILNTKKTNITHWKSRAIWDNTDEDMSFKKCLGLLTEKGATDYGKIVEYYKQRNTIAHGGTIEDIHTQIDMAIVIGKMKTYFKELKK